MLDRVRTLAQFIKEKKARGEKYVVMLGAGASLSSGISPTATIMRELVEKHPASTNGTVEDRFDTLWSTSSRSDRLAMLEPYLTRRPSEGYRQLADLIKKEYFDLVVTFNFDKLLEKAFEEIGFRDYRTIIRGETELDAIPTLLNGAAPRVKILKLHGSLESANYFLFSKEEMLNYPPELETLIKDITGRDIIICGYAFADMCVVRAFNTSINGGNIYFVNPSGAVDNIKGFLAARRSQDKVIDGPLGKFDPFFDALYTQASAPAATDTANKRQNLFKFLDYYSEDQKSWFLGRAKLRHKLKKQLDAATSPILWLTGKPKVGKTSFVRAGLMARLDSAVYKPIYVRCRNNTVDVERQLRADLERQLSTSFAGLDIAAMLDRAVDLAHTRLVIVLDQFERPCRAADENDEARQTLLRCVNALSKRANELLTVVFVSNDESAFWKLMVDAVSPEKRTVVTIPPLSAFRVGQLIRYAARKGGASIDQSAITAVVDEYQRGLNGKSDGPVFCLTHVQTVCYYLARGSQKTWNGADRLPGTLAAALDSLKDDASLLDVLDELASDEQRRVIRSFLKVICDPANDPRSIIAFIRKHFPDIDKDSFPEPIV